MAYFNKFRGTKGFILLWERVTNCAKLDFAQIDSDLMRMP